MTPQEALKELVDLLENAIDEYEGTEGYRVGKQVVNTVPVTMKGVDFLLSLKKVSK